MSLQVGVRAHVVGIVAFLCAFGALEWGIFLKHKEQVAQSRLLALTFESGLRAGVDRELNSLLNLTTSLASYLEIKAGRVDDREINAILANLYHKSRHVLNFGLAVGYRLTYVYPVEGNEKVIGLYYPDVPAQWAAVQRSIDTVSGTLAGPTPLLQGGTGLIYRVPVRVDDKYWGLLSTVIDASTLFQSALQQDLPEQYEFAVRGRDGLGASGEVFWGDPRLFDDPSTVRLLAKMPGGEWLYAVRPKPVSWWEPATLILQVIACVTSAVFGYFLYKFQKHRHVLAQAARLDPLTQLPNRRAFLGLLQLALEPRRKAEQANFALLFLDLDRFKAINDTYGHKAGDAVLIAVAERLRRVLRAGDVIGRWGGDELVILVRDASAENLRLLLQRARATIAEPIPFDGRVLTIGTAIGAANFPEDGATAEALFHVADERMYLDKQGNLAKARDSCN